MKNIIIGLIVGIILTALAISYIGRKAVSQIELEKNTKIDSLELSVKSLEDSLRITQAERDVFFQQKEELQTESNHLIKSLNALKRKHRTTVANLSDNEIIKTANREYGGDTTGHRLYIPKNTVVYLIDISKEHKETIKEFEILMRIRNNYYSQLQLDSVIINKYEQDKVDYVSIIVTKNKELEISDKAFKDLKNQQRKNNITKNILITTIGGLVLWQVLTK